MLSLLLSAVLGRWRGLPPRQVPLFLARAGCSMCLILFSFLYYHAAAFQMPGPNHPVVYVLSCSFVVSRFSVSVRAVATFVAAGAGRCGCHLPLLF